MDFLKQVELIASDLDGTLLNKDKQIPSFSAAVFEQLQSNGHHMVLATGRHLLDTRAKAERAGVKTHYICANGAQVYTSQGELVAEHFIAAELVADIITHASQFAGINSNIYARDRWFISFETEWLKQNAHQIDLNYELMNINQPPTHQILKVYFTSITGSLTILSELERSLHDRFADQLSICFSSPQCLEVMASGVSKLSGVRSLCEYLDVDIKRTLAFGDGMNDIEILSGAGKGVLMGTAATRVKDLLPDATLIGSCEDQAVANYLEANLLHGETENDD